MCVQGCIAIHLWRGEMINYTVIKARHSLNFVFIHEGLHVELHLYLNVYMDGTHQAGLGWRAGWVQEQRQQMRHSVEIVCTTGILAWMASWLFTKTSTALMQPEVFFHCLLKAKTNFSYWNKELKEIVEALCHLSNCKWLLHDCSGVRWDGLGGVGVANVYKSYCVFNKFRARRTCIINWHFGF